MRWDELPAFFPEFPEPGRWLPLLQQHAAALDEAAPRVRTSAVPAAEAVRRHYAESLEIVRLAGTVGPGEAWIDVGSGGGFPGIVVAAVLPEARVHLVEPLQKRATLLADIARGLDLGNVTVHPVRAEAAGRGPLRAAGAAVTARAVAPLRELLEYTVPLAAEGGRIVLPKGSALDEEVTEAQGAMGALGCTLVAVHAFRPEASEHVRLAVFERHGPVPTAYPRRPGVPAKRPL